jgi:hypothetical protein
MRTERIRAIATFLVVACLDVWSPRLCGAQQGDIYSGMVASRSDQSITLNLNPCGTQQLQTISPYKTIGNPTQESCPNGKQYTRVMVRELPPTTTSAAGEFSGEVISEDQGSITLDVNPCGEKKSMTISSYKKKGSVPASCSNGKKYAKVTVEKITAKDKN